MLDTGQDGELEPEVQEAQFDQQRLDITDRLETIAGVKRGIQDVNEGRTKPLAQFDAEMRQKHSIPR